MIGVQADVNAKILGNFAAAGLGTLPFMYLSDIQESQIPEIFSTYGAKNLQNLKHIRDEYDPDRVFTDLVPGCQGCLVLKTWRRCI